MRLLATKPGAPLRGAARHGYGVAVLAVAAVTALALPLRNLFLPANVIMLYLLAVTLVARYYRRGPAVLASVLAVAAFDFFFIKPHLTFAVEDMQYAVTFGVMLLVGVLISSLTGRLEAQVEARLSSQAQIEHEQLRNSLLSSISHDLRTPLAGISGAASTLLTLPPDNLAESAAPLLATIRDESDRLALQVTNILDMTRLESGEVRLELDWLPLEEPVGAALTALEKRLEGRAVRVALPAELPLVKADAVLLERLLANLLDNALRYSPAGTPLDITAAAAPDGVTISVADRGPGLPPGDPADLFRKFGRPGSSGATSSPHSRGTGLGLSICKAIAAAHGGELQAANRPGGGAVFSLTLPQAGAPPPVPAEPPLEEEVR